MKRAAYLVHCPACSSKLQTLLIGLTMLFSLGVTTTLDAQENYLDNPPKGFIYPPLHPAGVDLVTKELAPRVYALVSSRSPVNNGGFVVGDRGVLVIDAGINGAMAAQIQKAVRQTTSTPIRYLINTNHLPDHTFGNYEFPSQTQIIAHRATAEIVQSTDFEQRKKRPALKQVLNSDISVVADVQLRVPDTVFDHYLRLDLGGVVVELHHFGAGNTLGDTVVYVPEARVAWTGNLVVGRGSIPPMFEGRAGAYLETIARFKRALEVDTIIPGHGALVSGAILSRYVSYISELLDGVRAAVRRGQSLQATLDSLPLGEAFLVPDGTRNMDRVRAFWAGMHRLNVFATYRDLSGT